MNNKYYCRNCKGKRNHKTLFEKKNTGSEADGAYQWVERFLMIECSGCETISFAQVFGDNLMYNIDNENNKIEYYVDTTVFPYYIDNCREIKDKYLLPEVIKIVYQETLNAFKSNCFILTAGGFRAIIEALCNHLKIRKDDLSVRINLLYEKGFLTKSESKRLHSIRFLGNDSLHEMEVPKVSQLIIVLEIVNHLLENLFIHDKIIEDNIDVIIDKYECFIKLLNKLTMKNESNETEFTLNKFLGKSKRLIRKEDLAKFEEILLGEINEGKISFISSIGKDEKGASKYKIEETSNFDNEWL